MITFFNSIYMKKIQFYLSNFFSKVSISFLTITYTIVGISSLLMGNISLGKQILLFAVIAQVIWMAIKYLVNKQVGNE